MVWLLVSVLGFIAETSLIILLGRHVTGPYEAGREDAGAEVPAAARPVTGQQGDDDRLYAAGQSIP